AFGGSSCNRLDFLFLSFAAGNGRNGEVALDRWCYVIRQQEIFDMHAGTDIEAGNVNFDMGRNGFRRAYEFDFMANDIEHTAALQTWRLVLAGEFYRHHNVQLDAWFDLDEIDMLNDIGHGMKLHILRQRLHGFIVERDVDQA